MKLPQLFLTVAAFFFLGNAAADSVNGNVITFLDSGTSRSVSLTPEQLLAAFASGVDGASMGFLRGEGFTATATSTYKVNITFSQFKARNSARAGYIGVLAAQPGNPCDEYDAGLTKCNPSFVTNKVIVRTMAQALLYFVPSDTRALRVVAGLGVDNSVDGNNTFRSVAANDYPYAYSYMTFPEDSGSWYASGACGSKSYDGNILRICADEWNGNVISKLDSGFSYQVKTGGLTFETMVNSGMLTYSVDPTPVVVEPPPGGTGSGSGTGTGTGSGTGSGSTVNNYNNECTKADGTKTTSQVLCAPTDSETNCSILDLPCVLRKLLIPDPQRIKDMMSVQALGKTLNLPIRSVDSWEFDLVLAGTRQHFVLDFSWMVIPDSFKNVIDAIIGASLTFWLFNYLGLPNPLGSPRGGGTVVSDTAKHFIRNRMDDKVKK
jgi:hypothetical protein